MILYYVARGKRIWFIFKDQVLDYHLCLCVLNLTYWYYAKVIWYQSSVKKEACMIICMLNDSCQHVIIIGHPINNYFPSSQEWVMFFLHTKGRFMTYFLIHNLRCRCWRMLIIYSTIRQSRNITSKLHALRH